MPTDTERIDMLERFLASEPDLARVILTAWYSKPGKPDGFSCAIEDDIPNPVEFDTLREAIDDEIERYAEACERHGLESPI